MQLKCEVYPIYLQYFVINFVQYYITHFGKGVKGIVKLKIYSYSIMQSRKCKTKQGKIIEKQEEKMYTFQQKRRISLL